MITKLQLLFILEELLPKLVSLGCYQDRKAARLLRIRFGNFARMYNASNPKATVVKCAHLARDKNYEYFAIQNYGECRTDVNIIDVYDKYGKAQPQNCLGGVGATLTNFVYRLRPAVDGPNVCDATPCKNGGTCVVHFNDPNTYYCECADWFTGYNCTGNSKLTFSSSANIQTTLWLTSMKLPNTAPRVPDVDSSS